MGTKLEYIWTVVSNILMVVVALAIFQRVSKPFEVFVVSGIIVIYVGIEGNMTELQRRDVAMVGLSNSLLLYIIKLLKDPDYDLLKEQIDRGEKKAQEGEAHYVINTFARVLTLIIVAYYLTISLI